MASILEDEWISCVVLQQKALCLHNSSPAMAELDWIIFAWGLGAESLARLGLRCVCVCVCLCQCMRVRDICCVFACVFEWMFVLIKHQQLLGPGGGKTSQPLNQDNAFCVTGAGVSRPASPPSPCISSLPLPSHLLTLLQSHSCHAA